MLNYAVKTDIGCHRENNEDSFLALAELNLWLVADGVGGLDAGEVASDIACKSIASAFQQGLSLDDAISHAHSEVLDAPNRGFGQSGMASTIVALLVHGNTYQVSWVGDSRVYLWSSSDGLQQITRDHSLVQRLIEENHLTPEQASTSTSKNIVLQVIGQKDLPKLEVETTKSEFCDGQIALLCSDGLSDYVSDDVISSILSGEGTSLQQMTDQLVQEALDNDGADNITVMLVELCGKALGDTQSFQAKEVEVEVLKKSKKRWFFLTLAVAISAAVVGLAYFLMVL